MRLEIQRLVEQLELLLLAQHHYVLYLRHQHYVLWQCIVYHRMDRPLCIDWCYRGICNNSEGFSCSGRAYAKS